MRKPPAAPPPEPERKRIGRPPTGIKSAGRSVSLPNELWDWVHSQPISRSEFIEALVRKAMNRSRRKNAL